jgi:hypothetical protein
MRTGSQHYPVSMVTTPCLFGGSRWWWVCPATGRRVGKLYLPNGGARFLSRGLGACQLAYWLSCARAAGTRAGKTGMRGLSRLSHRHHRSGTRVWLFHSIAHGAVLVNSRASQIFARQVRSDRMHGEFRLIASSLSGLADPPTPCCG